MYVCIYVCLLLFIESSKLCMYQLLWSWRAQKCECISLFAHRELKSANVSAVFAHGELNVRMYQLFCSSRARKCECITLFALRELNSANVSAVLLVASPKVRMYQCFHCAAQRQLSHALETFRPGARCSVPGFSFQLLAFSF